MSNQSIKLNLIPDGISPIAKVSQFDVGRIITFLVYQGADNYIPPSNTHVEVRGRKSDGNVFVYGQDDGYVSMTGNAITLKTSIQMTACAGDAVCQFRLMNGDDVIATLNFIMAIQLDPAGNGDVSESELPGIISQATQQMKAAEMAAEHAAASEAAAKASEESAETHAKNALASEEAAKASEDAARTSEGTAKEKASAAEDAANFAVAAQLLAETAKNDAEAAKNDAETAKIEAEAAKNDAETAEASAQAVKAYVEDKADAIDQAVSRANDISKDLEEKRATDYYRGMAASISVGKVETVSPLQPASIENVGTDTAAIFDFKIPKGEKGDAGDVMIGATETAPGGAGVVPKPLAGQQNHVLCGDGTFRDINTFFTDDEGYITYKSIE